MTTDLQQPEPNSTILHVCKREILRPIRDAVLRSAGFSVESTCDHEEAVVIFKAQPFTLVLVDVEGEEGVSMAENLCSEVRTIHHDQLVAFLCNWRVALMTDCPDHILRTEFDPEAFVAGVREMLATDPKADTQGRS